MHPKAERADLQRQPRVRKPGDQARAAAVLLLLTGCGGIPDEVNPAVIWSHATGESAAGRLPPPGLEEDYPNLGTVPPPPPRPDSATRAAVTAALEAERARMRQPGDPGVRLAAPASATRGAARGLSGPPSRPSLSAAPRIPWEAPPGGRAGLPSAPSPAALPPAPPVGDAPPPAEPARAAPAAPQPAAPSAAPPPPPSRDLLAPAAPTPGAGPPPPPSRDLFAPPRGG
jgi:hypothetical protein